MESLDRVRCAIEFNSPDCFPIFNPYRPESSDMVYVGLEPGTWRWTEKRPGVQQCIDLFGCTRRRTSTDGIGEVVASPITDWSQVGSYRCPDIEGLIKDSVNREIETLPRHKFVIGDLGQCLWKIFEVCGFSQTMMGLITNPDEVMNLLSVLSETASKRIELYRNTGQVHAISMFDDWGTQEGMLISPDTWREVFLDNYRGLFARAHEAGLYVYYHSCGAIGPIIPDLIEAGVDILNFMQPSVHGPKSLWERFGGKVTFACTVDQQQTLPTYDKDRIRREAAELVAALHHNGGFIACVEGLDFDDDSGGFDLVEFTESIFEELRACDVA